MLKTLPKREFGITFFCTSVGSLYSKSFIALKIFSFKSNDVKVLMINPFNLNFYRLYLKVY